MTNQRSITPIFIGGHRKCGTTMFHQLFDGHPQIMMFPTDLAILYAYYPEYTQDSYTDTDRRNRLKKVVFEDWRAQRTSGEWQDKVSIDEFEQRFFDRISDHDVDLTCIEDVLEQLVVAFRETQQSDLQDRKYTVLKETSMEIYGRKFLEAFPGSRFLHLVRDPRDNFGALKAGLSDRYGEHDTANSIMASLLYRYKLGLKLGRRHRNNYSNRYTFIRFEDLTRKTEQTMEDISAFLQVDYNNSLLQPTVLSETTGGNSFEDVEFDGISSRHVGKWPERITEQEAKLIEFYFQEYMEKFDYELIYSEQERARAATTFYKWANYEYFFFDRFEELDPS